MIKIMFLIWLECIIKLVVVRNKGQKVVHEMINLIIMEKNC